MPGIHFGWLRTLTEITLLVKKKRGGSEKTLHNFCFCFVVPLDRAPPWTSHPWKGPRKGWSSLGWWEVEPHPEGGMGSLEVPPNPNHLGFGDAPSPCIPLEQQERGREQQLLWDPCRSLGNFGMQRMKEEFRELKSINPSSGWFSLSFSWDELSDGAA